jgi:Tfp pilus assembly protein PilO
LIVVLGSLSLVGLAAIAWFVVLAPRFDEPAEIQAQSESVYAQASRLEREIVQLTAVKENLPARVARFEQIKANFPRTAEIPGVLDQIRAAAARAGVTVEGMESSAPAPLVPAGAVEGVAPAEGAAAPAAQPVTQPATQPAAPEGQPAVDPAGESTGSVGVPAAGTADGNLATMPMSITVSGSYANLADFLAAAEDLPRAWLIDSLQAQGGQDGEQAGGEISLTASGTMFVLDTTGVTVPGSGE